MAQLKYSQVIGCLNYIANRIRPNIAHAIGRLSRYTSNPNNSHWNVLEGIMRYLKDTISHGLFYGGYLYVLKRYSDANWISVLMRPKPQVGSVIHLLEL